jgi:hypothetical protein
MYHLKRYLKYTDVDRLGWFDKLINLVGDEFDEDNSAAVEEEEPFTEEEFVCLERLLDNPSWSSLVATDIAILKGRLEDAKKDDNVEQAQKKERDIMRNIAESLSVTDISKLRDLLKAAQKNDTDRHNVKMMSKIGRLWSKQQKLARVLKLNEVELKRVLNQNLKIPKHTISRCYWNRKPGKPTPANQRVLGKEMLLGTHLEIEFCTNEAAEHFFHQAERLFTKNPPDTKQGGLHVYKAIMVTSTPWLVNRSWEPPEFQSHKKSGSVQAPKRLGSGSVKEFLSEILYTHKSVSCNIVRY